MPEPRVRVLIGDEEPLVCRFLRDALEGDAYDVEVSHDEADVLRRSRDRAFGLLILDYDLARRSGFQGILSLREHRSDLPIILMAAGGSGRAAEPVAFTYRARLLRKPFGVRDLRDAVERAVGREGC